MPRKTNKTSHVLNLITNGSVPEQEATVDEKKEEAQQEKKDAVTEAVQGGAPKETAQEAANPKEPVSRITANGDKTVIVVDETSRNDNISNKILDRLTDQLEEEIQGKLDHYHMVNVMEQILKRMNLKQYLKQYDVCMCSRCQADVMALILTRLPAKYVVVDESSTAPIIGFYESKFKVRILTEIIKACMDVKENPRHDRSGPYDK